MQEKRYPRALISALASEMSPELVEFFEEHKEAWIVEGDIVDYVDALWSDKMTTQESPDDFRKQYKNLKATCNRRKKQWLDALKANMMIQPRDSAKYPFKHIIDIHKNLSRSQWKLVYGGRELDEVLEDEMKKAAAWAEDNSSFLIQFPALVSYTKGRIQVAFDNDVLIDSLRVAERKYDFRIDNYSHSYAEFMTDAPFFSESARWLPSSADGNDIVYNIPMSEDGAKTLQLTVNAAFGAQTKALTMLDEKDLRVLSILINRAERSIDPTATFSIPVADLAKSLSPSNDKLSQQYYEQAKKRVYQLVNSTFNILDDRGRQVAAINFLDHAVLVKDGSRLIMDVKLGSKLAQAVMDRNIRRVQTDTIARISSSTGQILIMALQRERIKAYSRAGEGQSLHTRLGYSDFLTMIHFGSSAKRRNWRIIKETLVHDFVEKEIFIRSVSFDDSRHIADIEWVPFTQEEIKNLSWTGYGQENEEGE